MATSNGISTNGGVTISLRSANAVQDSHDNRWDHF